jgi:hypothetical protein
LFQDPGLAGLDGAAAQDGFEIVDHPGAGCLIGDAVCQCGMDSCDFGGFSNLPLGRFGQVLVAQGIAEFGGGEEMGRVLVIPFADGFVVEGGGGGAFQTVTEFVGDAVEEILRGFVKLGLIIFLGVLRRSMPTVSSSTADSPARASEDLSRAILTRICTPFHIASQGDRHSGLFRSPHEDGSRPAMPAAVGIRARTREGPCETANSAALQEKRWER